MYVGHPGALRLDVFNGLRRFLGPNSVPLRLVQRLAGLAGQIFLVTLKEISQLFSPTLVRV